MWQTRWVEVRGGKMYWLGGSHLADKSCVSIRSLVGCLVTEHEEFGKRFLFDFRLYIFSV